MLIVSDRTLVEEALASLQHRQVLGYERIGFMWSWSKHRAELQLRALEPVLTQYLTPKGVPNENA